MLPNQQQRIPMRRPESAECVIEVKKSKSGKKIKMGSGCSKEQLKMIRDSGEITQPEDWKCPSQTN